MRRLIEWQIMNSSTKQTNGTIGHTEFAKIVSHLETIYDCDRDRDLKYLYDTGFEISYGDQLDIYRLVIDFDRKTEKWTLFQIQTYPVNKIVNNIPGTGFNKLLDELYKLKIIKDRTICESLQSSTVDEIKEYNTMWDNSLLEWIVMNSNSTSAASNTNSVPKNNANNNASGKVVYAWDMYLDPADKGTFCSAEKYNGVWDGMVYETKLEAVNAGYYHLQELEDEGELSDDPDIYVEPNDYTIDVIKIPLEEVTRETLEYSNLDHLI